ncbi:hypothetical protein KCP76_04900 [Salmonella enterica subsp. enterica serovar Weltevreden]|nr:hypothetical protein KCP76_04900 [Salmonella enterica subsp. enterica serovar Weltevreden]
MAGMRRRRETAPKSPPLMAAFGNIKPIFSPSTLYFSRIRPTKASWSVTRYVSA